MYLGVFTYAIKANDSNNRRSTLLHVQDFYEVAAQKSANTLWPSDAIDLRQYWFRS